MSMKPVTWNDILKAVENETKLTKNYSGKDAYDYINEHFDNIKGTDLFYHAGKGKWYKKTVKMVTPPVEVEDPEPLKEVKQKSKIQCVKAPEYKPLKGAAKHENSNIPPMIPDVLPPGKIILIPELKGGCHRRERPKKIIEIYSIEDVIKCVDKNIIGFLPVFKDSAI